jgi:hypothetical protein
LRRAGRAHIKLFMNVAQQHAATRPRPFDCGKLNRAIASFSILAFVACATRAGPSRYEPAVDPGVGFNLWQQRATTASVADEVARMQSYGFNEVVLIPMKFMPITWGGSGWTPTGSIISSDPVIDATMSDTALDAAIRRGKSLGMKVTVSPFVQVPTGSPTGRQSVGFDTSVPAQAATATTFFNNYASEMSNWATIANNAGADRFVLGSELTTLASNPQLDSRWTNVINAVDTAFPNGQIGYNEVGFDYNRPGLAPGIRQNLLAKAKLDFLGVSAYFNLGPLSPTYTDLEWTQNISASDPVRFETNARNAFSGHLDTMHSYVQSVRPDLKLVIGEFGMPAVNGASHHPWESFLTAGTPGNPNNVRWDPQEAVLTYRAVMSALNGRRADASSINLWMWGWDGAWAPGQDQPYYLNPDPTVNPWSYKDIAPSNNPGARYLASFVQTVPEPATVGVVLILSARCLLRRATRDA